MFNRLSLFLAAILICSTLVRANDFDEYEDDEEPYETDFTRGFEEGL